MLVLSCITFFSACRSSGGEAGAAVPFEEMIVPGDSMYAAGDLSGAIRVYERVREAYPDSVTAYRRLTRSYLGLGMFAEARAVLDRTVFSADTLGVLSKYRRYAIWSIFAGDTTTLRNYTDSILRYAFHTYPDPYRNAAFNEVFLKDYDRAIAHLERYVAYGDQGQSPVNLAFLYLHKGDSISATKILGEAEERLTGVLLRSPADTDALFELAEIYAIKKDTALAMDYLERAVQTGLGKEWWFYHVISDRSVPDPVFGALRENRRFLRIKDSIMKERNAMRERVGRE